MPYQRLVPNSFRLQMRTGTGLRARFRLAILCRAGPQDKSTSKCEGQVSSSARVLEAGAGASRMDAHAAQMKAGMRNSSTRRRVACGMHGCRQNCSARGMSSHPSPTPPGWKIKSQWGQRRDLGMMFWVPTLEAADSFGPPLPCRTDFMSLDTDPAVISLEERCQRFELWEEGLRLLAIKRRSFGVEEKQLPSEINSARSGRRWCPRRSVPPPVVTAPKLTLLPLLCSHSGLKYLAPAGRGRRRMTPFLLQGGPSRNIVRMTQQRSRRASGASRGASHSPPPMRSHGAAASSGQGLWRAPGARRSSPLASARATRPTTPSASAPPRSPSPSTHCAPRRVSPHAARRASAPRPTSPAAPPPTSPVAPRPTSPAAPAAAQLLVKSASARVVATPQPLSAPSTPTEATPQPSSRASAPPAPRVGARALLEAEADFTRVAAAPAPRVGAPPRVTAARAAPRGGSAAFPTKRRTPLEVSLM